MAQVKIELSDYIKQMVDHVAGLMERSRTDTLGLLLFRVETLCRHGKAETFGLEWQEAATILNAQGGGAKHVDPVMLGGGEHITFDISLLEVSSKSKGGYTGVNATTGSSFRALVPDVERGGTRYLASRPTSLEAAIDRYRWFERYGLAYGDLGRNVEHWKKMRPAWSMEEILVSLVEDASSAGDLKYPYTLAQAEHLLARFRGRNKAITGPVSSPAAVAKIEPVPEPQLEVVACTVCHELIDDANDASISRTGFTHRSCA